MIPNHSENIIRELLIAKVKELIQSHNQVGGEGVEILTFGSYASKGDVGLYSSDVDMIVKGAVERITGNREMLERGKEKSAENVKRKKEKLEKWRKIVGSGNEEKEEKMEELQDYEEFEEKEEKEQEEVKKKEVMFVAGSDSDDSDSDSEGEVAFEIDRGGGNVELVVTSRDADADADTEDAKQGGNLEVHMSSTKSSSAKGSPSPTALSPTAPSPTAPSPPPRMSKKEKDAIRKDVVKALRAIARKIAACRWCSSIECRSKAKVPIINFVTSFGVEGDVGCGGSMGVDTSDYSTKLVNQYPGVFEPLVLIMKMLLRQADLDKPFTGGIGSYKLYVMIAHHLEQESEGRKTLPPISAVFIAFLDRFRRGGKGELKTQSIIRASGGVAEFKGNFRISEVSAILARAWACTSMCIKVAAGYKGKGFSYIACLVDHAFLRRERNTSIRKAQKAISTDVMETRKFEPKPVPPDEGNVKEKNDKTPAPKSPNAKVVAHKFTHPGKTSKEGRKKKRARAADLIDSPTQQQPNGGAKKRKGAAGSDLNPINVDKDANQLVRGYGYASASEFYQSER